jgi:1-acyl-sn-glycerol-3-phosphate acyltransferase
MLRRLRSIAFTILLVAGSFILSLVLMPLLALPRRFCVPAVSTVYGGYIGWIERYVLGLKLEWRGLEHLPQDTAAFIIAAKHQSAYETLKIPFMRKMRYPVIVLKKELIYLPGWGFYPPRMGLIAIDRSTGPQALQQMIAGARRGFATGRPLALFPEGTRKAIGAAPDYKPGLAKIYRDLQVPVVPMALNSGVFWGRNKFFKEPGTVVFEFLPPLPAGMPPLKMMAALEAQVEAATARLVAEAEAARG